MSKMGDIFNGHIFVTMINNGPRDAIESCVKRLLKRSKLTEILVEEVENGPNRRVSKVLPRLKMKVSELDDITAVVGNADWPHWHSRNCLIWGNLKQAEVTDRNDLFFLHDCRPGQPDGDFDLFCQTVLSTYDWGMFRYFTTFRGGVIAFITSDQAIHSLMNNSAKPALDIYESYSQSPVKCADLRSATFDDYNGQWLIFQHLAKHFGEAPPFLLCVEQICSDESDAEEEEDDHPYDEYAKNWADEYFRRLEPVIEFSSGDFIHKLFKVTDLNAYNALWARISEDYGVVAAVFSADCNIEALKRAILADGNLYNLGHEQLKNLAGWCYQPYYGGGADEHHGFFYALDAVKTQFVWEHLVPERQKELLSALNMAVINGGYEDQIWKIPLLMAKNQQDLRLLCVIDQNELYEKWSPEDWRFLEGTVSFAESLEQLELLEEFSDGRFTYKITTINDVEALGRLWSEECNSIGQAIFTAAVDVAVLKERILSRGVCHFILANVWEGFPGLVLGRSFNKEHYFLPADPKDISLFYELLFVDQPLAPGHISRF